MKVIEPSYEIEPIDRNAILKNIEKVGRTCYKSEDKITEESASKFVTNLRKRGHTAMLEFGHVQVKFITNRGFTHELVRHRLASYAQESTRYCDYEGELVVIHPYWWDDVDNIAQVSWKQQIIETEETYQFLRQSGLPPQAARGVLPLDVKTEINICADLTEWLHIFRLRTPKNAHPDMQRLMIPLQKELIQILPEVFGE